VEYTAKTVTMTSHEILLRRDQLNAARDITDAASANWNNRRNRSHEIRQGSGRFSPSTRKAGVDSCESSTIMLQLRDILQMLGSIEMIIQKFSPADSHIEINVL
jgi:hypothetical protein